MPANKLSIKQRNEQFAKNALSKPGAYKAKTKADDKPAISPTVIGLLIFIICGSAVIGLLQTLLASFLSPQQEITEEMMQQMQMYQQMQQQQQQQHQEGFAPLSDFPITETQDDIAITPEIENMDLDNEAQ